jgi:hypothetical protein
VLARQTAQAQVCYATLTKTQNIQGAAEKIKRETDVHLRQLAKKSTYLLFFFFF